MGRWIRKPGDRCGPNAVYGSSMRPIPNGGSTSKEMKAATVAAKKERRRLQVLAKVQAEMAANDADPLFKWKIVNTIYGFNLPV